MKTICNCKKPEYLFYESMTTKEITVSLFCKFCHGTLSLSDDQKFSILKKYLDSKLKKGGDWVRPVKANRGIE